MFFGPAHTLTQYSSLPRRSHMTHGNGGASTSSFQRNTPIRRSTGIPEHHMEYFVPRSISEFNLSGVGDLALPPPRRFSPNMGMTMPMGVGVNMGVNMGMGMGMGVGVGMGVGMGMPHGLQLGPPQTLLCSAAAATPPAPPPAQLQIVTLKPRSEKMVTFEDESKSSTVEQQAPSASSAGADDSELNAALRLRDSIDDALCPKQAPGEVIRV
ncbi:hypothetical protein ACLKA6_009911 [Drosophila palustris]